MNRRETPLRGDEARFATRVPGVFVRMLPNLSWLFLSLVLISFSAPCLAQPTLFIERDTGSVTLDSSMSSSHEIIEYDIRTTSGNFNPANWDSIEDQGIDSNDVWFQFSSPSSKTELAEGTLGHLTLSGAANMIDFGDVWVSSPFEDVEMKITLPDSTVISVPVVYSGNGGQSLVPGDYAGPLGGPDGVIDRLDWPTVRDNMLRDVSAFDPFGRYLNGDINQDGLVDRFDFRTFKTAFDSQNGAGSFAALLSVPEPTSIVSMLFASVALIVVRRRRVATSIIVVVFVLLPFGGLGGLGGLVGPGSAGSQSLQAQVIFTETWNTNDGTAGDWTSFLSFSENRTSNMTGQEGDRARAINNTTAGGTGYVYNNLTSSNALSWQPNTRYTIDVLAGYRSPGFSGALDFGLWNGVPSVPATQPSLGTEGFVDVAEMDGDPTPNVPDNTFVEVASLTDSSVIQFQFETGSTVPSSDLVLFLRNTVTEPMSNERVYTDYVRLKTEELNDLVTLVVDPSNGLMQLRGAASKQVDFDYFQIESAGGFLLAGNWDSLDEQAVGDNAGGPGWEAAGFTSSNVLAELFLDGAYSIPAGINIGGPLGPLWDAGNGPSDPLDDLSFLYTLPDGTDVQGLISIESIAAVNLPGDFNNNGTVDAADFTVWRDNLGTTTVLANDPSPGLVSQDDYNLWAAQFGTISSLAVAVPEPDGVPIATVLGLVLAMTVRRRCQNHIGHNIREGEGCRR